MGNDRMSAIKEQRRLSKDRSRRSFSYVNVAEAERLGITQWKSSPGDNFLYVVPAIDKVTKYFAKEVYIHSQVGPDGLTFICPRRMKEEPCPICEALVKMRKSDSGDERLATLTPKLRFLFFVVDVKDRETEKKGIRWYDAPGMVNDGILGLSENKRTGEITDVSDPINKLCVTFTRVGSRMMTKYESFTLEKYQDGDIPKSWYTEIPTFDELLQYADYKTIEDAFAGYDKDQTEEDDVSSAEGSRRSSKGKEEVDREEPEPTDDVTNRVRARMEKEDREEPRRERPREERPRDDRVDETKSREERSRESRIGRGGTEVEERAERRERREPVEEVEPEQPRRRFREEREPEDDKPRRSVGHDRGAGDLDD